MAKVGKRRAEANKKIDIDKFYGINEAMAKVKEVNTTKFDASVDLHIRLGVDPRKADQAIRGSVSLPHGTGKVKRVLVFCTPDKEKEALDAGADYATEKAVGGAFRLGGPKSLPKFLRKQAEANVLGVNEVPTDAGYRGGRLQKGSQEAKDRMAKLRAMRNGGSYKF